MFGGKIPLYSRYGAQILGAGGLVGGFMSWKADQSQLDSRLRLQAQEESKKENVRPSMSFGSSLMYLSPPLIKAEEESSKKNKKSKKHDLMDPHAMSFPSSEWDENWDFR